MAESVISPNNYKVEHDCIKGPGKWYTALDFVLQHEGDSIGRGRKFVLRRIEYMLSII